MGNSRLCGRNKCSGNGKAMVEQRTCYVLYKLYNTCEFAPSRLRHDHLVACFCERFPQVGFGHLRLGFRRPGGRLGERRFWLVWFGFSSGGCELRLDVHYRAQRRRLRKRVARKEGCGEVVVLRATRIVAEAEVAGGCREIRREKLIIHSRSLKLAHTFASLRNPAPFYTPLAYHQAETSYATHRGTSVPLRNYRCID